MLCSLKACPGDRKEPSQLGVCGCSIGKKANFCDVSQVLLGFGHCAARTLEGFQSQSSNLPCFREDYQCSSLFQLWKCQPWLFQSLHFTYRSFFLTWILMLTYSATSLCFFNLLYVFEFRGEQVQTLLSDAFRFFCHTKQISF